MADTIQVGTVGMPIRVTLLDAGEAHDPSSATYREITITRPGGADPLVKFGSDVLVTVDSQDRPCLQYITQVDDLPNAGTYKVQGFLVDAAGQWPSSVGRFRVARNIRTPTE